MTLEQKKHCIIMAQGVLAMNLEAIAAEVYPKQDFQSLMVGDFGLLELLTLVRRACKQLVAELATDYWKVLPDASFDGEQNSVFITKEIGFIFKQLNARDAFDTWIAELNSLILYEMNHGFWDRSKTRVHNPNDLKLAKTQTEAGLLIQDLNNGLAEANKAYKRLSDFTEQKEQQFNTLEKNLELASNSLTSIRDSEKESAVSNSKISTILEQTEKSLEDFRKKTNQDRSDYNALQSRISSIMQKVSDEFDQLNHHREEFDALVVSAKEAEEHILDQEERIMALVGFAADGTLGGVFDRRKKELEQTVYLWIGLSFLSVAGALYWAHYIFDENPVKDINGLNWLLFVANAIRTSPAFIFVFFCLTRYSRERNIQEEYAHKAAVSMTVTAYADMIGTGEVNERVKMIIDTIQRIYAPPTLDKPSKPVSLKSKHLAEATKNVADATGNLKTAVTDALKNLKPDKPA